LRLLFPVWPFVGIARAIEAVLRNSLFRSGYELFFVPMDVDRAPPHEDVHRT
jgi:hypothetical protein